jgi:hypothetical protein
MYIAETDLFGLRSSPSSWHKGCRFNTSFVPLYSCYRRYGKQ